MSKSVITSREQAFGLYRMLERLTEELSTEQQRQLLGSALEEVVSCVEEMETADKHLLVTNQALELERQYAEDRERRYRDLFDSAPCGYLITDFSGVVREINQAAAGMLGGRAEFLRGKPLIVFLPEADRARFHDRLADMVRQGGTRAWPIQLQGRGAGPAEYLASIGVYPSWNGRPAELRWTLQANAGAGTPVPDLWHAVGEWRSAHASAQGIAERALAEVAEKNQVLEAENSELRERILEQQRMMDGVVARIRDMEAHLNRRSAEAREAQRGQSCAAKYVARSCAEPLRNVHEQAAQLLTALECGLPDSDVKTLTGVVSQLEVLNRRMDAVGALAKAEELPLNIDNIDPALVVAEALNALDEEHAGRNMDIRIGTLPECRADREMLHTIFYQLLSNSIKMTRFCDTAKIEVGCRHEKRRSVWFVRDNGIGWAKDQEHRLFLPFRAVHRGQGYEGPGVGLAIVKQMINRHGGRIWAEGRENKGATFFFTLGEGKGVAQAAARLSITASGDGR